MNTSCTTLSEIGLVLLLAVPGVAQSKRVLSQYSVAVLNFENLSQGNPTWNWLGKELADLVIGDR